MFQKQLAISSISFIILLLWYAGYSISCVFLIFPLLIGMIIFKANYEYAVAKKICTANCFFKQDSFLYTLLTKKIFIVVMSFLSALMLSSVLMLSIISFNIIDFVLLAVDVVVIVKLYNYFNLNKSLNKNVKEPIVKNTTALFSSIICEPILNCNVVEVG